MFGDQGKYVKVDNARAEKLKGAGYRDPYGWLMITGEYPDRGLITVQVRNAEGAAVAYTIRKTDVIESIEGSPSHEGQYNAYALKGGRRHRRTTGRKGRKARKTRRHR